MVKNRKSRILVIGSMLILLIVFYILSAWLVPTLSRYIKREQDEIRGYYTALYFTSTGEGKTIALEEGVGYIDFELRNYIGENVTQRDIVYTISKPSVFYDAYGDEILEPENHDGDLYVKDVWGTPQKIAKKSYLYDVEIVQNNGEIVSQGVYTFTYEKLGTGAKGKVHTVTCKVSTDSKDIAEDDEISLVVQMSKPYKEVLIINMKVSNRLITFSHKEINIFNVPLDKIYVQTADLFSYYKQNVSGNQTNVENHFNNYYFTSYAFRLSIKWEGYILDELKLEDIHMGTSSSIDQIGDYDVIDQYGNPNDLGTTPNDDAGPYIDITKSTISYINSYLDEGNHKGELIIYVPQGSNIFFHFLKSSDTGSIDVKVEAYVRDASNGDSLGYKLYDDSIGGYTHVNDYFNLASYGE